MSFVCIFGGACSGCYRECTDGLVENWNNNSGRTCFWGRVFFGEHSCPTMPRNPKVPSVVTCTWYVRFFSRNRVWEDNNLSAFQELSTGLVTLIIGSSSARQPVFKRSSCSSGNVNKKKIHRLVSLKTIPGWLFISRIFFAWKGFIVTRKIGLPLLGSQEQSALFFLLINRCQNTGKPLLNRW